MADINPLSVGGNSPVENRYPNLTNEELKIIGYFAQGQKHAISNKNLKLEYSETSIRLSNSSGKSIGISKQVNEWQRKVLIANNSAYRTNIVRILTDLGFITKQKSSHPDFTEHHHYKLPDGYQLNYTNAIQLWKIWWNNKRYQLNVTDIAIDLLVFIKGNWYQIRDLQPKQGKFIIQTLRGEKVVTPENYLIWLNKIESQSIDKSTENIIPQNVGSAATSSTIAVENIEDRVDRFRQTDASQAEPEEDIDLESYLNTFNTEDSEDIDRIEGIYNINELLGSAHITDDVLPPPPPPPPSRYPNVSPQSSHSNVESMGDAPQSLTPPATNSTPELINLQRKQALKFKAIQTLTKFLEEGDIVTYTKIVKNDRGEEIEHKITTIQRGCPSWAIEQIERINSGDN